MVHFVQQKFTHSQHGESNVNCIILSTEGEDLPY